MKNIVLSILGLFSVFNLNAQVPKKAKDINPLLIGEKIPTAKLQDVEGKIIDFNHFIAQKPSVVVFYRGGWCPYCNLQLSGLASIEKQILDLGYQIIAISPDDYQNLKHTEEQSKLHYTLLSDKNGAFIQEIGIAFETSLMIKGYIATKGQKGAVSDVIPVPTVMVLDTNGSILFEYINPNYKQRISGEMLLAVLRTIKK